MLYAAHAVYISKPVTVQTKAMSGLFNDTFGNAPKVGDDAIANMLAVNPLSINVTQKEYQTGYAANDRGLKYQIEGRATRIEVNVGNALATYKDPIKALFGTRICEGQKVQVVRKYVVGGKAVATPERAPARIVKVKEDAKEVELVRYGADLTMNLNLMLRPVDAREELEMKVNAQKQSLENELTRFGYEQALQGLKLGDAIARSKGLLPTRNKDDYEKCRNDVHEDLFACFQRYEDPLKSLIALAKTATAYRNVVGKDSIMILPTSTPEMLEYTKYMKLNYKVSGIKGTGKKALDVSLDDVYDDPTIGLKLMVHHPPQDHHEGQSMPSRGASALFRKFTIKEEIKGAKCYNMKTRLLEDVKEEFRYTTVVMGSAIIGVPGANTGELLVGYPFTATSTNQRTESMTVSLRVYLGAVLKQRENVLVLPNVYLDHVVDCDQGDGVDETMYSKIVTSGTWIASAFDANKKMTHASTGPFAEIDSHEGIEMARCFAVFKPKCKRVKECDDTATHDSETLHKSIDSRIDSRIDAALAGKTVGGADASKVSAQVKEIKAFIGDGNLGSKQNLHDLLQSNLIKGALDVKETEKQLRTFALHLGIINPTATASNLSKKPIAAETSTSAAISELSGGKKRRGASGESGKGK